MVLMSSKVLYSIFTYSENVKTCFPSGNIFHPDLSSKELPHPCHTEHLHIVIYSVEFLGHEHLLMNRLDLSVPCMDANNFWDMSNVLHVVVPFRRSIILHKLCFSDNFLRHY